MIVSLVHARYFNIWEALGLGYLAAYARRRLGRRITFRFFQGYFDSDAAILDGCRDADLVAFSCTTPSWPHALSLAHRLKERRPGVRTCVGGVHASALPACCAAEEAVDHVVAGEGEAGFVAVLQGTGEAVVRAPRVPEWGELRPDRALIRNERTVALCREQTGQRVASFQSVRGCPYRCTFCASRAVTAAGGCGGVAVRAAAEVVDEIVAVAGSLRLDHFKFVDGTWNVSEEKVLAFCEALRRRQPSLSWEANLHAARVTPRMLAAMREAGCVQVNVGCESGSERILAAIRKGIAVRDIVNVFDWARAAGLRGRAFFMVGFPGETREDVACTERLIARIDPDVLGVTIACPFPGTDLYDAAAHAHVDWAAADEYTNDFWRTEAFTNAELKALQRRLTRRFRDRLAWHQRLVLTAGRGGGDA
jgi:radical SAM superfamily enzyme YgiQ (UPF0313 family)